MATNCRIQPPLLLGAKDVAINNAAEANVLAITASLDGEFIFGVRRWALMVSTNVAVATANTVIRLYKQARNDEDTAVRSALVATYSITSAAPLVLEFDAESCWRMRVTAQLDAAGAGLAQCDFVGW